MVVVGVVAEEEEMEEEAAVVVEAEEVVVVEDVSTLHFWLTTVSLHPTLSPSCLFCLLSTIPGASC